VKTTSVFSSLRLRLISRLVLGSGLMGLLLTVALLALAACAGLTGPQMPSPLLAGRRRTAWG
jgi:hypothetical protein